jgi:hypothetical protein
MAKDIDPKLKSIKGYFELKKDEYFVIPEYQREYSWFTDQCEKLLEDIESFIQSEGKDPYFFGTIIIDCSNDINGEFSLIDGQQRTTTFLLLLKAMLLNLNNAILRAEGDQDSEPLIAGLNAHRNDIIKILYKVENEEIPSIVKSKDSSLIKGIKVFDNRSINEAFKDEVSIILGSLDFEEAERSVTKIPRKQKDNRYTRHFRNFDFFNKKLEEKSASQLNKFCKIVLNECQVIEIKSWKIEQAITMFNSLNSKGLPLSDADIISAQLYSNAGNENREIFKDDWEKLVSLTNELESQKIVDIVGVLQQYMYINRALDKEYISEREDGTISADVTTPGLRRYYIENRDLLSKPLEMSTNLNKIARNWDKIKEYTVVKLLLKFNENARLYLSSYLYRFETEELTEEKINKICETFLKFFALLESGHIAFSSSRFKTFMFEKNIDLVNKNISSENIEEDFATHISKFWNRDSVSEDLRNYEGNILVILNEYLYAKENSIKFTFKENVNIEHIMPASGKNKETIRIDAGISDKDEFNNLVNKLGNKILLEADINKSIGNGWFKTKKQKSIDEKAGYKNSMFGLAESLTSYPKDTWTKEDIEISTDKAVNRIVDFIFSS